MPIALPSPGGRLFELVQGKRVVPVGGGRSEAIRLTEELFEQTKSFIKRFPEQWDGWEHYAEHPEHGPLSSRMNASE